MEPINPVLARLANMAPISEGEESLAWRLARMQVDGYNATEGLPDESGYDCRLCRNKQDMLVLEANPDGSPHKFGRGCRCVTTRQSILRMKRSGLQNIIGENQFDKFTTGEPWQKTIKDSAVEYARDIKGWFMIAGQSGCGKTHLCTAICREALLRGQGVAYMVWQEDAPRLKAKINDSDYGDAVGYFKAADLLYIDDLFKPGKQDGRTVHPSSADIKLAFEILNHRYVQGKPTVISTEWTLDELIEIDEATAGRIAQRAGAFAISIPCDRTKNYRLKGAMTL